MQRACCGSQVKEDSSADSKLKPRMPMGRFVREYLMRQYGMKSMAEKATPASGE